MTAEALLPIALVVCALVAVVGLRWAWMSRDTAPQSEPTPDEGPLAHWFWRESAMTPEQREAWDKEHTRKEVMDDE